LRLELTRRIEDSILLGNLVENILGMISLASCSLIKENGRVCGSTFGINIIYFRDAHNVWKGEKSICQNDSQMVFGRLLLKEEEIKLRITKLDALRKRVRNPDRQHNEELLTLQSEVATKFANTEKVFHSLVERDLQLKIEMEKECWRRMKRMREILQEHRNKVCRLCLHPLNCNCDLQCKDRHWGDTISSVTVFSQYLYRRHTFNFHVICGRVFMQMFGLSLLPSKSNQMTLEQSLKELR